jgi:hypothetical protein
MDDVLGGGLASPHEGHECPSGKVDILLGWYEWGERERDCSGFGEAALIWSIRVFGGLSVTLLLDEPEEICVLTENIESHSLVTSEGE